MITNFLAVTKIKFESAALHRRLGKLLDDGSTLANRISNAEWKIGGLRISIQFLKTTGCDPLFMKRQIQRMRGGGGSSVRTSLRAEFPANREFYREFRDFMLESEDFADKYDGAAVSSKIRYGS